VKFKGKKRGRSWKIWVRNGFFATEGTESGSRIFKNKCCGLREW
jgi:hypothetical protein